VKVLEGLGKVLEFGEELIQAVVVVGAVWSQEEWVWFIGCDGWRM